LWPCAWLVLTFKEDVDKKTAVRRLGAFVKWLRRVMPGLEYAATYELTRKGRLHINLLAGRWKYVPFRVLKERWGARLSVEWVKGAKAIGREAAKAYSPEALGGYLSKLEQAVPVDRRVSYSRGWPKLPAYGWDRKGEITWRVARPSEVVIFEMERDKGYWVEVTTGEWALPYAENCDCFDWLWPGLVDGGGGLERVLGLGRG
jgi:hypothetical protein